MSDLFKRLPDSMNNWKQVAQGSRFFGLPISEMDRDELLAIIGQLIQSKRADVRCSCSRARVLVFTIPTCRMIWSFFNLRVCLTNDPAEWQIAQTEFNRVGLEVEKFEAVKEIGPHQSFSHSERNILLDFLHSPAETLLHLEDDVVFRDLGHLPKAIDELPEDWDILYLGANLLLWNNGEEARPERYSEHLFRVRNAWTTHGIAYNKKCVRTILERQPMFSVQMYDNFLSNQLSDLNAYIVAPMVAYQRSRFSAIWDRVDDYTEIFEKSDERLR